jgi:hypothetical protein
LAEDLRLKEAVIMRLQIVVPGILSLAALILITGCAAQSPSGTLPPADHAVGEHSALGFQPRHVYAVSGVDQTGRIVRFPLKADGLPRLNPDGQLFPGYNQIDGIAFGPDGDLYVSNSLGRVDVFTPGATGRATPIRSLIVPRGVTWLAVDGRGFLSIAILGTVYVYKPNAQGHDQPLNTIKIDGAQALAADTKDRLYIQTIVQGVAALRDFPAGAQPAFYNDVAGGNGVAVDSTNVYATYWQPDSHNIFLAIDVFNITSPGRAIRSVVATGCVGQGGDGVPPVGYGLAVFKQYAFEACVTSPGPSGQVQVYDTRESGRQRPIVTLPYGNVGVAIGP